MATRKDRNSVIGRIKYVTDPALQIQNFIKQNYKLPDHKAWDKMANLAEIGFEAENSGLGILLAPFNKKVKKRKKR